MRILIARHADPDYAVDGLTEVGKREAELLSHRLVKENISKVYCSIYGRARMTVAPTLEKLGLEAEYCEWLREFDYAKVDAPMHPHTENAPWDQLPEFMAENEDLYNRDLWHQNDLIKNSRVYECYQEVCREFDQMMAKHGYVREGINYKAVAPNHDTVLLVCHYGVESVLLSHIMNCSPYTFWQNSVVLPSGVTIMHTEERREGIASIRVCGIGDISHLYAAGTAPSFSARFCECFTDETRHD